MIFPKKLKKGDGIRIIAPSRSMGIISEETQEYAEKRLNDLGFKISYGKYINERDEFNSSKIESRVDDLHEAFSDQSVSAILTVIGGFNSNQLLRYIDWDLIRKNPKIFCGYSDVTILNNAFLAKSGLVSYYGPHFSSFGQKKYFEYTLDYFIKCCVNEGDYDINPSDKWSDDAWYLDQEKRELINNIGWWTINNGDAEGEIVGGNLDTFNLLQGTEYYPSISGKILFIEDDEDTNIMRFDRCLQSLIQQNKFHGIRGLIIGRFQKASKINKELLIKSIRSKGELNNIPIIANVDFGHTDPKITFPIGGQALIKSTGNFVSLKITKH